MQSTCQRQMHKPCALSAFLLFALCGMYLSNMLQAILMTVIYMQLSRTAKNDVGKNIVTIYNVNLLIFLQNVQMAAASGLGNSSASEGSSRFRPLFLQRVCNSALTVRDKLGFTRVQPTVAGMSAVVLLLLKIFYTLN